MKKTRTILKFFLKMVVYFGLGVLIPFIVFYPLSFFRFIVFAFSVIIFFAAAIGIGVQLFLDERKK